MKLIRTYLIGFALISCFLSQNSFAIPNPLTLGVKLSGAAAAVSLLAATFASYMLTHDGEISDQTQIDLYKAEAWLLGISVLLLGPNTLFAPTGCSKWIASSLAFVAGAAGLAPAIWVHFTSPPKTENTGIAFTAALLGFTGHVAHGVFLFLQKCCCSDPQSPTVTIQRPSYNEL